jgi:hypothetical protein
MSETMRSAGVHLSLGPELETLLQAAGAQAEQGESDPATGHRAESAALITAITLERFRQRAVGDGASGEALDAAIGALLDPERVFTGPTRWVVRCHVPN